MSEKPKFMTHERIMAGEEYVSYSDYLLLERERNEARELAQELLDALSKLVALNAEMTSDDCTYERAYYCYYKGHYDKWKLATETLAKAKEGAK